METPRQRYPISSQTFPDIREEGYVYIDKTDMVYEMTHGNSKYIFLSRPRRFGKSLLVSTLRSYFEGRKELFEGLAIDKLEKEWTKYPVIHLDMSRGRSESREQLQANLNHIIDLCEWENHMPLTTGEPNIRFDKLVTSLYEKTGQKVVVLIDEYDSPLLDVMHNEEMLSVLRNVMRNFYSPLKASANYLRFVFLTGITKFSQLSIFSELNNIVNISMDPKYATVCGITEEEMLTQLRPGIELLAEEQGLTYDGAVEQLKLTYDGYHFTWPSPDIYNPYSLLRALSDSRLEHYWFGSGTPTFLIEMLRRFNVPPERIGGQYALASSFDAPTETITNALPLLYQSGYITINGFDKDTREYLLEIPNKEVHIGLMESLLREYVTPAKNDEGLSLSSRMYKHMKYGEIEEALKLLQTFLAGVPYNDEKYSEGHFQSLLYVVFKLIGRFDAFTEVRNSIGRSDMVVRTNDRIYLFELKFDGSAEEALRQIDIKNYIAPFSLDGLPVVKIGMNFSSKTRTITDWLIDRP